LRQLVSPCEGRPRSIAAGQKAAAIGLSVLVAVSAPTALAVRMAEAAGITLIAVARS